MPPIVLLCDDPIQRRQLAAVLTAAGFAPALTGRRPPAAAGPPATERAGQPLFVLDLGDTPGDSLDWCRETRRLAPGALICAVMREPEPALEIAALEQGADAVVAGPPDARRLAAQLGALLRPLTAAATSAEEDLRLDAARRVVVAAGRALQLTDAEFALLAVLHRHRGHVLSRDELSQELRGRPCDAGDRSLDLRVARLRRRLGDDVRCPRWIRSVRSEGYVLLPPTG